MRKEATAEKTYRFVTHPKLLKSPFGDSILRYTFQYVSNESKSLLKFGKEVYKRTGVLPNVNKEVSQ